jgi:hypothetical protein
MSRGEKEQFENLKITDNFFKIAFYEDFGPDLSMDWNLFE